MRQDFARYVQRRRSFRTLENPRKDSGDLDGELTARIVENSCVMLGDNGSRCQCCDTE